MKYMAWAAWVVLVLVACSLAYETRACYLRIEDLNKTVKFEQHKNTIKDRLINNQRDRIMVLQGQ
jgi:hypothetical protein